MQKVKFFACNDTTLTEKAINDFIADKEVVDIQYQSVFAPTAYNIHGNVASAVVYDRVMVVYREEKR